MLELDHSKLGHEFPAFEVDIEKGRLKFFAEAIGETNPIYRDEAAAKAAGHRALPALPTFPIVLDMESPEYLPVLKLLGMSLGGILHADQTFEYFGTLYAGDTIAVTSKLIDMAEKKGGALLFITVEASFTNQDGELVAKASQTLAYRNS